MKTVAILSAGLALCLSGAAWAQGLTAGDFQYLQTRYGIGPSSSVLDQLTPNEAQSLHSAIDDLKNYPAGRDREVQSYLALVYGRECTRWERGHPGQPCKPPADSALAQGAALSDRYCAECHLFGTETAPSFHRMAGQREWNSHKVSHALQHSPEMVPVQLTPAQLDQVAAYINSLR
jgi:hypothetical protein